MLASQIGFDSWLGRREHSRRRPGQGSGIAPPERSEAPSL